MGVDLRHLYTEGKHIKHALLAPLYLQSSRVGLHGILQSLLLLLIVSVVTIILLKTTFVHVFVNYEVLLTLSIACEHTGWLRLAKNILRDNTEQNQSWYMCLLSPGATESRKLTCRGCLRHCCHQFSGGHKKRKVDP